MNVPILPNITKIKNKKSILYFLLLAVFGQNSTMLHLKRKGIISEGINLL
jgi:hypothetical protein